MTAGRSDDIMQIEFVKISPDDIKENSDIHVFVKYILSKMHYRHAATIAQAVLPMITAVCLLFY